MNPKNNPRIPTQKKCIQLLQEKKVPKNIIKHSLKVRQVAMFIAKKMQEQKIPINTQLVNASALLHDIAKHTEKKETLHHALGAKQLKKYPQVAQIISEHGLDTILKKKPFTSTESKIVYYADKRVKSDKIVTLKERFKYLLTHYGTKNPQTEKKIKKCLPKVKKLEKELQKKTGKKLTPGEIT
jgi:putative nucleotidyltransferase with HDIG domain